MALLLGCLVVVVSLDQVSKAVVTRLLPAGRLHRIAGRCALLRVDNHAGGLLRLSRRQAALVWLAVVACVAIEFAFAPDLRLVTTVGLGLTVGGATGNLADRIVRDAVVDFIALGRWPAFNVADAALVVGALVVPWGLL